MSSFICDVCGELIIEDYNGFYITGCPHWPISKPRYIKTDEERSADDNKADSSPSD